MASHLHAQVEEIPPQSQNVDNNFSDISASNNDLNKMLSSAIQKTKGLSESMSDVSVASYPATPLASCPATPVLPPRRRNISTISLNSESEFSPLGPAKSIQNLSRASSTMSLTSIPPGMGPMDALAKHVRDRLSGKLFSGWYTERRFIDAIDRYKDVIVIDNVETQVIKQIKYAIRKSNKILADNCFIGFAADDEECKVYVSLGMGATQLTQAFGRYWFHIRHVSFFAASGFNLDLAIVRQFANSDTESCWECRKRSREVTPPVHIDSISSAVKDIKTRLDNVFSQLLTQYWQPKQAWTTASSCITRGNVLNGLRFLCVLILTLVTGSFALVQQMGAFSLRALHELAFLVDRSTPFALAALNFASKIVGGFYLLLAMIWKDFRAPKPPPKTVRPGLAGSVQPPAALPAPRAPPAGPVPRPNTIGQQNAMDNMYSSGKNW